MRHRGRERPFLARPPLEVVGCGMHWFFVEDLPQEEGVVALTGEEARHASARRLREGEAVTLFDGRGGVADGVVCGRGPTVTVRTRREAPPPSPLVEIATALPKGDRFATLLGMATQLGMAAFIPLACSRSVVRASPAAEQRWRRLCLEACKQSRRAWLPRLEPECTPAQAVSGALAAGMRVILADPRGADPRSVHERLAGAGRVRVIVGPEGGLSDEERKALSTEGVVGMSLGDGILRVETAVVAVLSVIRVAWPPTAAPAVD